MYIINMNYIITLYSTKNMHSSEYLQKFIILGSEENLNIVSDVELLQAALANLTAEINIQ